MCSGAYAAGAASAAGAAGHFLAEEARKPAVLRGAEEYGRCMTAVRDGAGSVRDFTIACVRCHSIEDENIGNAVIDQCKNQMAPAWCLTDDCKKPGCKETKECKDREATAPPLPAGRATALTAAERGKATPATGEPRTSATPATPEPRASQPKAGQPQAQTTPTGDSNADQQRCQSLSRRAFQCCQNPASCMTGSAAQQGPAPGQGLNEYCEQMRAAGRASGTANQTAGGICYQAYQSCANSCDGMASGYSGQAAQQMRDAANGCRGLSSRVAALGNQSLDSHIAGGSSDICNRASQAAPQGGGGAPGGGAGGSAPPGSSASAGYGGDPNDPYGCAANPSSPACTNCSVNPNSPACRALALEKDAKGEAGFGGSLGQNDRPKRGDFNINSQSEEPGFAGNPSMDQNQQQGGAKNATVANNSGGAIPGGGGSGGAAKMDSPRGGTSPGSPGYTTDVLQGLSSPGGYSQSGGSGESDGGGGGYGNRRAPSNEAGMDLSQFLPGGSKDPNRRALAGAAGYNIHSAQINGRFVNIWNRISERMQEKCRLGQLVGCE